MTSTTNSIDYETIKARQQRTWSSGDYHTIASLIVPIAEQLCDALDLQAGERVLDVATGSGNAAIAAARRLCTVTGIDYVPTLLERARARATAEALPTTITFREGDAEALPVADSAFDVVLSTFGVMFAPDQERAARELLRTCRPGGRIGLANWTPEGWIGEMLRVVSRYVPPPAGLRPATRWGSEGGIRDLLGSGTTALTATRRIFVWRFASAQQYLDLFRTYYGPTLKAFEALDQPGRRALASDLLDTVVRYAQDSDGTLCVPAEYLEVVAERAR
ncbi:MAG: class I SAM-dependent methyltransferase [Chloroflexi bacterium]|nr:class I SAM-dependent methyltransferase [Chloroflexota bacterium]MBV9547092.1 class I SAM-dependent methyltransferase [Chloroflexota bacterium]